MFLRPHKVRTEVYYGTLWPFALVIHPQIIKVPLAVFCTDVDNFRALDMLVGSFRSLLTWIELQIVP